MKRIISVFILVASFILLSACKKTTSINQVSVSATISKDTKYGAATVSLSQEEFENHGFALGDSCDVSFASGCTLSNVPYYNGYYVKGGEAVIVAYPGASNIAITYNLVGIWDKEELAENELVTITLKEKGKYSAVQDTLGQIYSFDYNDYDSSYQFSNFRALSGGNLKENFLYRGASPVDSSRGRAPYTDRLLAENNINFVVDLADSLEDMNGYIASETFNSPYTKGLYENGNMVLLDMSASYESSDYQMKVATGMKAMINASGPAYIHCMEGKDRTGFVSMLLEALAGASYTEMRDDYMKTYENYYSVSLSETPDKFNAIVDLYFDPIVSAIHTGSDLKTASYIEDAKNYLIKGGMSEEEVLELIRFISK